MPVNEVINGALVEPAVEPKKEETQVSANAPEKNTVGEVHVVNTKAEEKKAEETKVEETKVEDTKVEDTKVELQDKDVLSFIKTKFGKEVNNLEELFKEKESEPLPSDVESFLKFKKDTGRNIEDYLKLQKDYEQVPENELLKQYYIESEPELTESDVEMMIQDEFDYDEDYDDAKTISKKQIAKKKKLSEAKKYFNEQKEKYKVPVVSTENLSPDEVDGYKLYKEQLKLAEKEQENVRIQSLHFETETSKVFSNEFKGFEFNIKTEDGKKTFVVPETNAAEIMRIQSNPRNIIQKFLDSETGLLKDAKGYHKALAAANNPDKYAEFFYELGRAEAIEKLSKEDKNINMSTRRMPESVGSGQQRVRAVEANYGSDFKFRVPKR
jgi:hypothetical protein